MQQTRSALLVASGAPLPAVQAAPRTDFVIAVDAGLEVLIQAQRRVDVLVGDLDSVAPTALVEARHQKITIKRFPRDKDESDLELALTEALQFGANQLHVVLRDGGRLDHQLANLLVLASPRWRNADIDALVGFQQMWVVHRERSLPLTVGAPLALHAVGGTAHGVTATNLLYPLEDQELPALVALGIANRVIAPSPTITVSAGVVIAISAHD
ncbi:MAG: thiamine diphosphokinase [Acidimicrobiia bacterium]|nr:thiamine diphosphokinase [Acidimicrobiia bacterium]MCY4458016.1 thiamine diphosphokinase [Acidimicrobiaceae bacterium]